MVQYIRYGVFFTIFCENRTHAKTLEVPRSTIELRRFIYSTYNITASLYGEIIHKGKYQKQSVDLE